MTATRVLPLPAAVLPGWARPFLLPAALVGIWAFLSASGWGHTQWLASPAQVWREAIKEFSKDHFLWSIAASLARDAAGFLAGGAAGLAFGAALAALRPIRYLLLPLFHGLRQIALFAWVPLISVWIGYNDRSRILLIALSVFYPVALAAYEGLRNVARTRVEVGRALGFSRSQILFRVIAPSAAPSLLAGLNLGLIYAWAATVGAEYLLPAYSAYGLGDTVIRGRAAFRTETVLFGMLVIGLIGWGISLAARRLERWAAAGGLIPETGARHD
jgi:sulfonate transport system permease protein